MDAACSCAVLVHLHQTTRCYIPEDSTADPADIVST